MNAKTDSAVAAYSNPWTMWLNLYHVLHVWQLEWCHVWARYCLPSPFPPHPHEGHHQLELPDPLEASTEPELFA